MIFESFCYDLSEQLPNSARRYISAEFPLSRLLFSSVPPCDIHSGNCPSLRRFFRWLALLRPRTSFVFLSHKPWILSDSWDLLLGNFLSICFSTRPSLYHSSSVGLGGFAYTSVESHLIRTCLIYCGSTVVAFDHACPTLSVPCRSSHIVY